MNIDERGGFCHVTVSRELPKDYGTFQNAYSVHAAVRVVSSIFQSDVDTAKFSLSDTKLTPEQCISLMKEMGRKYNFKIQAVSTMQYRITR